MKDQSKNKKSLTKPILTSVLFIFFLSISFFFVVSQANAATQWVSDPATCNVSDAINFPGQNCDPTYICGDNSGIAQCYDTTTFSAPAVIATSNILYSASYPNGGYILNCYAAQDSAVPYCDNNTNYWCNRSTDCYTTQRRDTVCTASTWAASTCGSCRTGYADCDAGGDSCEIQFGVTNYPTGANNNYADCSTAQCDSGWTDCNASGIDAGDGCEIQEGAVCTVGALTGTWSGCTCLVGKQYFETGTEAGYATSDPLLWGVQHGTGDLIHFGNGTDPDLFIVTNDGSVQLGQIVAPVPATDQLYNVAGDLYWNGAAIGAGAGGDSLWDADGDTGIQVEETADEDKIRFDTGGTERMIIDAVGNVGIGGNTPRSILDIGEGMIVTPSGDTSIILTADGGDTFLELGSTDMSEGLILHGDTSSDSGLVRQIGSSGYANGWAVGLHLFNEGAEPIIFTTNGGQKAILDADGDFGIGIWNPTATLDVARSGAGYIMRANYDGGGEDMFRVHTDATVELGDLGDLYNGNKLKITESLSEFTYGPIKLTHNAESGCIRYNDVADELEFSNDCVSYNAFGSGSGGSVSAINFSTVVTAGSFSSGGFVGYEAGNDICNAEFAGSHFCRTDEIIQYIDLFGSVGFTGTSWIAEGPPGYTSNSNDCNGWTDNLDTKMGAFWHFINPGGGMGWLTNCAVAKSLACCE